MNRSLAGALAVAALAVIVIGRSVFAEPPPPMESRPLKPVIAALEKEKSRRSDLAAVRYYADVLHGTHVNAPIGSPLTTLGAWSDNTALMSAEGGLNACGMLPTGDTLKKASALATEFGDDLPPLLRAYTLAAEGKKAAAVAIFTEQLERSSPPAECPGEHPMYSHRRVSRMNTILSCVKTLEPTRDVKKLQRAVDHAQECAMNNHAVG